MNQEKNKKITLAIVIVVIVAVIWYLEAGKPASSGVPAQDLNVAPVSDTSSASGTVSFVGTPSASARFAAKIKKYSPGKELADIQGYINSPVATPGAIGTSTAPFKLADYIGKKVILVDFWTYSCINCLRTLPYLEAWDQKYRDQGLMIVGVHTPEFDFEKDLSNVTSAVQRLGIRYPVVLDSNRATWDAYQNQYWPHEYLIDIDGFVVDDHIGEGGYAQTEQAIQAALKERAQVLGAPVTVSGSIVDPSAVISMNPDGVQSPETYFGSGRNEYLGNGTQGVAGKQTLTLPGTPSPNTLYLGGTWNFTDEYAENTTPNATILFNYNAKNVYFVAAAGQSVAATASGVKVTVMLDGKPIPAALAGADVGADGTMIIKGNRLYSVVNGGVYGPHTIELEVQGTGLDAFTFTFG